MANQLHPAEIALAKLRDFPEEIEAQWSAAGRRWHVDFRKYARPIIDEYFASVGGKLCREPNAPAIDEQKDGL